MRSIYLDCNATTPIAPRVREAMLPFLAEHYGNPSSSHALGRACHLAVEDARKRVAALVGAQPDEIVFTSGGSESNNLALKGVALAHHPGAGGHLVVSAIEHPAVIQPAKFLERLGYGLSVVGCDANGTVDPAAVEAALRSDTLLVSVMHANNQLGTVQPIRRIAEVCRRRGILLHTDAAQSAGKVSILADDLGVDLLTIAGHKMYAPKGVGALYVRQGVRIEPLLHGAGHERGLRAGTENVAYLVGLGAAAMMAASGLLENGDRMTRLRDRLQDHLSAALGDAFSVNGLAAERLPNTLSANFGGADAHELLRRCPELCASTGAACHAGLRGLSATMAAIRLSPETARGTIRLSLGWYTCEDDVDRAAELLIDAWENVRDGQWSVVSGQ